MTSITDSDVQQMLFCMYTVLAGNSILMYDHMATLPEEIVFIWRRPKALSAILFLLNRYVALLSNICGLVMDFVPVSDEVCFILILGFMAFAQDGLSCLKYALYRQLAILLQTVIVCIIMTIRIYALYDCSKRLLAWMGIVMVALTGLACVGTFGHFSGDMEMVPGIGCNETFSKAVAARIGLAYVALLIFDIFIFILTVYRIYKTSSLLRFSLVTRRNIVDTIFCDGAIYFGAMALSNIPTILTYYFGSVGLRGSLSTFTGCMSVTLISRLMLNLHQTIVTGIFSTTTQDDVSSLPVLTTRVNIRSAISSHHW